MLTTPVGDDARVETLAPQDRPLLTGARAPVVFGQDRELVFRTERSSHRVPERSPAPVTGHTVIDVPRGGLVDSCCFTCHIDSPFRPSELRTKTADVSQRSQTERGRTLPYAAVHVSYATTVPET